MSAPVSRPPRVILASLACLCAQSQLSAEVTASCAGVNITTQRAVYVSTTGSDNAGCGAAAATACKTIQQGIGNCSGAGCGVVIRHGLYRVTTPVTLTNSVSVYGSCSFDGNPTRYRTAVAGPSPVIIANQITSPTTMHGLVVNADDATNPGQASIAMTVSNSSALIFSHNVLASGKGASGQPGAYADGGPGGGGSYPNGHSGGSGGPACPSNRVSSDGDGGQGADYQQIFSNNCVGWCLTCDNVNYPNYLGRPGHNSGAVSGGKGGLSGSPGCACQHGDAGDGPPGVTGNPGECGTQGGTRSTNIVGSFNGASWVPGVGGAGDTGKVGSGGGGGGSGGFAAFHDYGVGTLDFEGHPGGGGGGGGCGGPGGSGGGQGGASIPLVLVASSVQGLASTNVLIPGPGGRGGDGAVGGKGGPGGPGQQAGQPPKFPIDVVWICSGNSPGWGGKGGDGGQGGAGSGGAGGSGGPSFGIALVGGSPASSVAGVRIYPANPGIGGFGGAGGQNTATQCKGAGAPQGLSGFADDNNSVVTYQ